MVKKCLSCPECSSTFRVSEKAIGDTGRMVRCAQCKHEWLANRLDLRPDPATADEIAEEAKLDIPQADIPQVDDTADPNAAFQALMGGAPIPVEAEETVSEEVKAEPVKPYGTTFDFNDTEVPASEDDSESDALQESTDDVSAELPEDKVQEDIAADTQEDDAEDDIPDVETLFPNVADITAQEKAKLAAQYRHKARLLYVANAACVLLVLVTAFIAFRSEILRIMPYTKPLYAAVGYHPTNEMTLADIVFSRNEIRGESHYSVKGNIVNREDKAAPTPSIRARLLDDENDVVGEWNLSKDDTLEAMQSKAFNARKLRSNAEGARTLSLEIGSPVELMLRR